LYSAQAQRGDGARNSEPAKRSAWFEKVDTHDVAVCVATSALQCPHGLVRASGVCLYADTERWTVWGGLGNEYTTGEQCRRLFTVRARALQECKHGAMRAVSVGN